ncbi:recombination repair protein 1 isoform X2 [Drosophila kikkawai]|uniref:DNA-(apurinic or apyrimidinic site) endonuclease n=1 Tax=Drosophila kikkawai TaxID=30033 RepID=A0A6P4I728_DROKI|nr:recombination repair protein 1 isoform X2 [Drosophila kikkawai]
MPRAKTVKKQAETADPTPNGNSHENPSADSAAVEAIPPAKGKPRSRKATTKATAAVEVAENALEVGAEEPLPAAARGKKKQPKDTDAEIADAKPKGRGKKASAKKEEKIDPPAAKASKSRAKKEPTSAPEEVAAPEPKARGRKRKESPAAANGVESEEQTAEPPKRRAKKEPPQPPIEEESEQEPVPAPKKKVKKAEPAAAKRVRGTKGLADSEITAALEDEEEEEPKAEPQKAASKRTKKPKALQPEDDPAGDSDIVPPKSAVTKRGKKTKQAESAQENGDSGDEASKPTKQRAKKKKEDDELPAAPSKKRGPKKENNGEATDQVAESKPVRGRKREAAKAKSVEEDVEEGESSKTKKPKKVAEGGVKETLDKDAFALADDKEFNLKISSWNVAGLRAWLKKDGLQLVDLEEPDIFCLQETKCANEQLPEEVTRLPGYHPYWLCMPGGYAGVAIYSKIMPIHVEYGIGNEEFDDVGRMITAEYEKFYLINVYVPNSGRKLVNLEPRMRWEKLFQAYVQKLDALKPVVICGDMNVSHMPIDLENPKANTRNAGFTKEERDKMTELLDLGFVDTFRHLYPDQKGAYTFWTYMSNARARNVGWRLDYCIVSERFLSKIVDHTIRKQMLGSDHCPITVFFNI